MGSLPRDEQYNTNTYVTVNITNNAAAGSARPPPGSGPKSNPATFKALLPLARNLIGKIREFADAGKASEVDLCLLNMLEDWIAVSQAEIEGK